MVLDTRPSRNVTVTIHDPANTEVTAEPASRTFTPNNWHVAKTVTVTAGHDSDVTDEAAATITHTVSSTFAQYDGLDADRCDRNGYGRRPADGVLAGGRRTV